MNPHPLFLELYQAISAHDLNHLKMMLSNPSYVVHLDWDDEREDMEPLLELAISTGDLEIVQILLEKGGSLPYWSTCLIRGLELAARLQKIEFVRLLLQSASPIDWRCSYVLVEATRAYSADFQIVKLLVESGAPVNAADEEGITPLMMSCITGSFEIVKFLIEAGAEIDVVDRTGWRTAHYLAQKNGHENITQYLEQLK